MLAAATRFDNAFLLSTPDRTMHDMIDRLAVLLAQLAGTLKQGEQVLRHTAQSGVTGAWSPHAMSLDEALNSSPVNNWASGALTLPAVMELVEEILGLQFPAPTVLLDLFIIPPNALNCECLRHKNKGLQQDAILLSWLATHVSDRSATLLDAWSGTAHVGPEVLMAAIRSALSLLSVVRTAATIVSASLLQVLSGLNTTASLYSQVIAGPATERGSKLFQLAAAASQLGYLKIAVGLGVLYYEQRRVSSTCLHDAPTHRPGGGGEGHGDVSPP